MSLMYPLLVAAVAAFAIWMVAEEGRPSAPSQPDFNVMGDWLESHVGAFSALKRRSDIQGLAASCIRDMPEMLDILTLGLTAGLSFDAALELYGVRFDNPLSRRLMEARLSWRLGLATRSEALYEMANELDVSALRRFAGVVTEALAFGAPLSTTLSHQAETIREDHRFEVEEEIEKIPVRMLLPLTGLVVPAMLLSIVGPLISSAFVQ